MKRKMIIICFILCSFLLYSKSSKTMNFFKEPIDLTDLGDISNYIYVDYKSALKDDLVLNIYYRSGLIFTTPMFISLDQFMDKELYDVKIIVTTRNLRRNINQLQELNYIKLAKKSEHDIMHVAIYAEFVSKEGILIAFTFNDLKGKYFVNGDFVASDKRIYDFIIPYLPYEGMKLILENQVL